VVAIAIQSTASTAPAIVQYSIEYGIDIPLNTDFRGAQFATQWFSQTIPIYGADLGFNTATLTPISAAVTILSSTTPVYWIPKNTAATSSHLFVAPTFLAPKMRINASMIGSNGAFWINAILKESVR
jgi:hypothetical protein